MKERLLRAIGRAHFQTVLDDMDRETLTYSRHDEIYEEDPLWSFKHQLEAFDASGKAVN